MISVGRRDGRKGVELGFGSREDMVESELEEGEACCNDLNDDENNSSTIDPDVDLSYLDEKLQDVLGHFQKDFEGGVSAENLGAKFGGYGSFLPTYHRSPSWSHPRTPPKYNHYGSRSPDAGRLQNGQANSFYSPLEIISSNSVTGRNDQGNEGVHLLPNHGKELSSASELPHSTNLSDQKTLKVRIKVGKEDLSSQRNAEIYTGLGLDVSPSSSLSESPTNSEGLHHDLLDIQDESLTHIIQIMSSARLFGSLLLSPLSDEVIRLTEKRWASAESETKIVDAAHQGSSRMLANGSGLKMTDRKMSHGNKPKLIEQSAVSVSPTNSTNKYNSHSASVVPRKEFEIDALACEELISSTLKLPLLSDADMGDLKKDRLKTNVDIKAPVKGQEKNDSFSTMVAKKPSEPVASLENSWANKSTKKSGLNGKAAESRKTKRFNDNLVYHEKEADYTDELAMKSEAHVGQGEISVGADVVDTSQQIVIEKNSFHDEDRSRLTPGEVQLSSGCKKRTNGDQIIMAQDVKSLEDGIVNYSHPSHQSKKSSNSSGLTSKSDSEKLKKGLGKAIDRSKECFGNLELERDKDDLLKGKGTELVEKRSIDRSSNILKEKAMGKTSENLSALDHQVLASNVTHLAGKVPNPDADSTAVAPLLSEDWVCCDKCQTWRLLPLGTNPKSLPEKWVCSMLDWLPGMNHCSISENETTLALRAAQASATSGCKHNQHPPSSMNSLGVSSGDSRRSTDDYQYSGFQETNAVKKNNVAKYVPKETTQENFPLGPNTKKCLQEFAKSRSLNDIDKSPSTDDFGNHHAGQSSFSLVDRSREKDQNIPVHNYSDKDGMRASKKMKFGDSRLKDENFTPDLGVASSKAGPSSNCGLSDSALGKDRHDSNHLRDLKCGMKNLSGSSERPDFPNSVSSDDGSQLLAMHSLDDDMKKSKVNNHISDVSLPGAETHSLGSRGLSKECQESGERKEKRARVSKFEGEECKGNTDNSGTAKKVSRGTKENLGHDLVSTASQQSTDGADTLRRDLGALQHSVAAASSSSKVSSSRRSKASIREMKDSPIESVSSSPLRNSNVSQFRHTRRDSAAKDDFQDAGFFVRASPGISAHDEPMLNTDQTGKMRCDDNMDLLCSVENKAETSPPHFTARQLTNGNVSSPGQGNISACQIESLDQNQNDRDRNVNWYAGHSKKAGKGFSLRSKEKKHVSRSVYDNGMVEHFASIDEPLNEEKGKGGSNESLGKLGISCDRTDKGHNSKKDSAGNIDCRNCKEEIPSKVGAHDGMGAKGDVISCQEMKQKELHDSEKRKSNATQPSLRDQSEATTNLQPNMELKKDNGECGNENDEQSQALKQSKRPEKLNANQQMNSRNSNSSTHKGRGAGDPKDSSSQAATNAFKEARELKHLADRFKNSGSTERTGLYFQAALKFLHGASLLECCSSENTKQTHQSMQMYSSTAKLCEFCAHEYEKSRDMAAAALAYKCVEVAYMRVIYTSHTRISKVRNEVQRDLQLVPTGDSPSSSASDIDNLNGAAIVDKAIASKGAGSPQVAGTHVLTARNRTGCLHLIQFVQEVSFAMEASRKSRSRLGEARNREGISSVKKALDFNFQDVDGLLRLVRVAMEAISR